MLRLAEKKSSTLSQCGSNVLQQSSIFFMTALGNLELVIKHGLGWEEGGHLLTCEVRVYPKPKWPEKASIG